MAKVIQTNGAENFGRFGKRKKGNTWKGFFFFRKIFHRDEPFHLNSPRNFLVFHTNGKRSRTGVYSPRNDPQPSLRSDG